MPSQPSVTLDQQRRLGRAASVLGAVLFWEAPSVGNTVYLANTRALHVNRVHTEEVGLEMRIGSGFCRFLSARTAEGEAPVSLLRMKPRAGDWAHFAEQVADVTKQALLLIEARGQHAERIAELQDALKGCSSDEQYAELWPDVSPEPAPLPPLEDGGRVIGD